MDEDAEQTDEEAGWSQSPVERLAGAWHTRQRGRLLPYVPVIVVAAVTTSLSLMVANSVIVGTSLAGTSVTVRALSAVQPLVEPAPAIALLLASVVLWFDANGHDGPKSRATRGLGIWVLSLAILLAAACVLWAVLAATRAFPPASPGISASADYADISVSALAVTLLSAGSFILAAAVLQTNADR